MHDREVDLQDLAVADLLRIKRDLDGFRMAGSACSNGFISGGLGGSP
jgi:hypothetical protein